MLEIPDAVRPFIFTNSEPDLIDNIPQGTQFYGNCNLKMFQTLYCVEMTEIEIWW
jgi:hypothetical protein